MKPFNLSLAKSGEPVCLKDGSKARIICFNRNNREYPIVALRECGGSELVETYDLEGHNISSSRESNLDLRMATKDSEGYVKPIKLKNIDNLKCGTINIYRINGNIVCAKTLDDAITLYYMLPQVEKSMEINTVELLHKCLCAM